MNQPPSPNQPIIRQVFLSLLKTALDLGELHYAQQIALGWLGFYPGDLEVNLEYARVLFQISQTYATERPSQSRAKTSLSHATQVLERITLIDPEFLAAQQMLAQVQRHLSGEPTASSLACLYILTGVSSSDDPLPDWLISLRSIYEWMQTQQRFLGSWEEEALTGALNKPSDTHSIFSPENPEIFPLVAVIQARLLPSHHKDLTAVTRLISAYHDKWSDCLPVKLTLANLIMKTDPDQAVSLLQNAVALDNTGQVARRIFGSNHPFLRLWPSLLEVAAHHPNSPQSVPIPARVSAAMGWNLLPDSPAAKPGTAAPKPSDSPSPATPPKQTTGEAVPGSLQSNLKNPPPEVTLSRPRPRSKEYPALAELKSIAAKMKQPAIGRLDGRYPVYVILTTWQGLTSQYGELNARQILSEMKKLAQAISNYRQWDSLIFIPDAPAIHPDRRAPGSAAIRPDDPWAIKLALADLDDRLAAFGEMIGAILIIGGPEIVPFHRLPNPVEDSDADVPSDNPYATRDENYFIPEWSVGRLPGGKGSDPKLLLQALGAITSYHLGIIKTKPWLSRLWERITDLVWSSVGSHSARRSSFGYSAAIWRRASLSVFRPIGDPKNLWVCPPTQVAESCALNRPQKPCLKFPKGRFAYFNLHGLPDSAEWYGQRDPTEPGNLPDFPLALRAADIPVNGNGNPSPSAPEIIFAEACYGAHILEKGPDEALAIRFLAAGCRAYVGSTCISYGAVSNPLIAADLLGHSFWHYLNEGQPAGEALRRAKIHLAREMNKRQGYLDGEDQKTLLSFILYGDPLVQVRELQRGPKITMRPNHSPGRVATSCDRFSEPSDSSSVPEEVVKQVKQLVSVYLPGMEDAEIHLAQERTGCTGEGHTCPSASLSAKSAAQTRQTGRRVVTLSKTIQQDSLRHMQFARLTLDAHGAVVKLAVSR